MTQLSAPVQILAVSGKQISTARGPSTIYEIKASDGREYSTFNSPVAQKANGLVNGAPVLLQYEEVTKGQYTNYRLQDILTPDGPGAVLPGNGSSPTVTSIPTPAALTAAPVAAQSTISVSTTTPDEKDARITRLSAASTAFAYAATVGLDDNNAIALAHKIEDFAQYGIRGSASPAPEQPQSPEPAQAGLTSTEIDW